MPTRRTLILALTPGFGLGLAAAALLVQQGCAEPEPDLRPAMLADLGPSALLPPLAQARERAAALSAATQQLCEAPDPSTLDAAQAAWWALREPWRQFRALPIGPLVDEGFDSAVDFWPARPSSIEGGVTGGSSTVEEVGALGVASKGLPAIEYLLWDPEGGDEAVLAALTAEEPSGAQRCAYLHAVVGDVGVQLEALEAQTQSFADTLATAGSNARYPTVSLAVDELLNAAIAGLHDLSERSMGKPLGLSTAEPDLEQLESRFSDRSRADILDALAGFSAFYLGGADRDGEGFTVIVAASSAEIDAAVRADLDAALAAAEALPDPLRTGLDTDPAAVNAAWEAIRALRLTLAADVAGLLGVTVSLSDNDGD